MSTNEDKEDLIKDFNYKTEIKLANVIAKFVAWYI